jgi:hypothetical protein
VSATVTVVTGVRARLLQRLKLRNPLRHRIGDSVSPLKGADAWVKAVPEPEPEAITAW